MSRVPEGKELLQVLVAMEVAQAIRVRAAMEAMSLGKVIEQAILATNAGRGVMESGVKPEKEHHGKTEKPIKTESKVEPRLKRVSVVPEDYKGKPWDQARLDRSMDHAGLSTRQMAEQLVSGKTGAPPSRNLIHNWRSGKEAIPSSYWPQLERIFTAVK